MSKWNKCSEVSRWSLIHNFYYSGHIPLKIYIQRNHRWGQYIFHFNLLVQNNLKDIKVIFQMNFNVIMSIMTLKFYYSICFLLMIMLVKHFLIGNFFLTSECSDIYLFSYSPMQNNILILSSFFFLIK